MLPFSRRQLEVVVRDEPGNQLSRCLVRRGRYVIGSEVKSEIVVDDASVSSKHARLTVVSDDELFIEDLESQNGTLVNGVPASGLTRVTVDSLVRLGATTLEFQRANLPAGVYQYLPEGFLREHRYDIGDVVVQGSTSIIFAAFDTSLGRDVAIKVMRPESQAKASHVLRFVREAQITSQLQHPNILPIYELSLDEQSRLYYTTRFVEGTSLAEILEALAAGDEYAVQRYPLGELLAIFLKACDAVAAAHARGVVHGGLRPEAINVGRYGEVFVVNWGLAQVHTHYSDGSSLPHPVRVAENVVSRLKTSYTAPEHRAGDSDDILPHGDIFSLGGILHQLLNLQAPAAADGTPGSATDEAHDPVASCPHRELPHCPGGSVPEALAALAMRMLSFAPAERPESVQHLQREIVAWQTGLAIDEGGLWKQFSGLLGGR